MGKMRAAVLIGPGKMEIQERDLPEYFPMKFL